MTTNRPRTAIGYDGTDIYLVTFCNDPDYTLDSVNGYYGLDLYEVHQIMKNNLGCTMGVNLDGGSSTAIAYKYPGYSREVRAVTNNSVLTMVTVPGASFENILP